MLKYTYLQNIICIIRLVNGCAISVLICLFKSLVANSLDHEAFMRFVQKILDDREKYTIQKRNLSIEIDKKIADLLLSSQMVSDWYICILKSLVSKGKSHKLLRKTLLKDKNILKKESEKEQMEALVLVPELKKQICEVQEILEK